MPSPAIHRGGSTGTGRWWTALAVATAALSLGLPWGTAGSAYVSGYFTPGMCATVYDYEGWASLDCTAGFVSPGFVLGGGEYTGAQHPARLFIAVVIALLVTGLRRHPVMTSRTAVVVGTVGFLAFGVQPAAGQLALAVSVAASWTSLRAAGGHLLPEAVRRPRTPSQGARPGSPQG